MMDTHICECAHPRSRTFCFLGQTRVRYSAGLSPLTGSPLQALREVACIRRPGLAGGPWREKRCSGCPGGKEEGDSSWSYMGEGLGLCCPLGHGQAPKQEHQHLSYFIVKSRHLCSVGWGDGREGPTEPHIQLSPKERLE